MNIEMLTTVTLGYGLMLFMATIGLTAAQLAGYWRWQNIADAEGGWPRAIAIIITLLLPFVISVAIIFATV